VFLFDGAAWSSPAARSWPPTEQAHRPRELSAPAHVVAAVRQIAWTIVPAPPRHPFMPPDRYGLARLSRFLHSHSSLTETNVIDA